MKSPIPIRILDGGLGTTLEDKHHVRFSSESTPLWSSHLLLTDQKTLLACQTDFACAGADVLLTATYQFSIEGFAATRTPEWPRGVSLPNIGQFLEDAVLIARAAGAREVAFSLGPYGATMLPASTEYSGKYDDAHVGVDALYWWHLERLRVVFKHREGTRGINYFAFETVPRLDEIQAIRRVLFGGAGKPYWISCVFPGGPDDDRLPDGSTIEDVAAAMLSNEVRGPVPWGIGINCTKVGKLAGLVRKFERAVQNLIDLCQLSGWPSLVLYPDGTNGEVYNTTTQKWELPEGTKAPETRWEVELARVVEEIGKRGKWASLLIGGCCKTTAEDITRLRDLVIGDEGLLRGAGKEDEAGANFPA
ncbi:Homocysteine S-methyltransferase [Echria macrotheca]|uniref:Homocysteine S-methyltransferase n=1 Tax=Echria macrotheca TaxID=438768 RepID=A0AAJ0F8A0_9PEZI|nr:Homocysteine S-methyltransferase [Echria macrotheca]